MWPRIRDLAAMMDARWREPATSQWGAFPDDAPWVLDRDAIPWWADAERLRDQVRRRGAGADHPGRLPPGGRGVTVVARLGVAVVPWVWRRRRGKAPGGKGVAELSRRLRLAAEALGPTFIKLGQIISSGEGLFPPELVDEFKRCRDQVPAESFDDVRRDRRGRSRPPPRRGLRLVRRVAARRGVDRPGARRPPAHRGGRRRQGAAPRRRPARPAGPAGDGVARAAPRRPHPGRRRWPTRRRSSSCSPTRSSRSSTSASRPPTCSTSRRCSATSARRATSCPRPHPDARHPPGPRDATPRRVQVRRRRRHAPGRRRHRGRRTHGDGRADGRGDGRGHLPRRPARRQPARAPRRAHRRCSTSGSSGASTTSAGWPSCG